jgi:Zn-dependent oligopeptidase
MRKLSHEERLLIQDLKLELERDGIHLSEENREIVKVLSSQVVNYETEYLKNLSDDCEVFEIGPFPIDYADRLKAWLQQIVPQSEVDNKPGYALCSSNKRVAASLLRQVHEESIRKQIYLFSGKYPSKNREALSGLVRTRQALGITFSFHLIKIFIIYMNQK